MVRPVLERVLVGGLPFKAFSDAGVLAKALLAKGEVAIPNHRPASDRQEARGGAALLGLDPTSYPIGRMTYDLRRRRHYARGCGRAFSLSCERF